MFIGLNCRVYKRGCQMNLGGRLIRVFNHVENSRGDKKQPVLQAVLEVTKFLSFPRSAFPFPLIGGGFDLNILADSFIHHASHNALVDLTLVHGLF